MKIAIIGSRSYKNPDFNNFISEYLKEKKITPALIISGGAKGVDTYAKKYAEGNNIEFKEFLPDYKTYPVKIAPLKRNDLIVQNADFIIAIWDGKSKGTQYVINYCKSLEKNFDIINF